MSKKERTLSDKLGFWQDAEGQPRRAYRARIPLRCAGCGRDIGVGEVFARRTQGGKGNPEMQVVPFCGRCLPLRPLCEGPPEYE